MENNVAGTKANHDCSAILSALDFRNCDIPVYLKQKGMLSNIIIFIKNLFDLFLQVKRGSTIVIQYPLLGVNKYLAQIIRLLKLKNCRVVGIIHDLDSLRQVHHVWTLQQEVTWLQHFDVVIVHNSGMEEVLKAHNLSTKMVQLHLFDYLLKPDIFKAVEQRQGRKRSNIIAFAGNLAKSGFLKSVPELKKLQFVLYGPGYESLKPSSNYEWKGSFDADELPAKLDADFGLIWDGDEIDACRGNMGNYLKYNNPHKASLYIVSLVPLVAPENTAIGRFILKNGLGITVKSLFDLPAALEAISDSEYAGMKNNLIKVAKEASAGEFLKQAIAMSTGVERQRIDNGILRNVKS